MKTTLLCFTANVLLLTSMALAAERPPNVVLLLSDDQAWTDYGFMGHEVIQTPRLDALAKESVVFTRGYTPASLCRASLMTIITGLYPHQHGVTGNDPPQGVDREAMLKYVRQAQTLPKLLGRHGYASFQSGKWWEGNHREGGFTAGMTHGDPKRGGRHGDEGLKIGRQGLQPVFDFIDQCGEKPFFLWYAPMMPHSPHNPPERLLQKYVADDRPLPIAKYYAMCEWWDETCGQVLDYLDQKQLSQNTLVVYVTDNGWIQDPASPRFAPRSKRSPNEGGVRTPIMFRLPGKTEPQRNDQSLASNIDLAPTILAACGLKAPAVLPGIDLLSQSRSEVYGEIFGHDVTDIDEPQASLEYRWIIDGDWKLILPRDGNTPELYNLKKDPHENENLAAQNSDAVRRLTEKLDQWWPLAEPDTAK